MSKEFVQNEEFLKRMWDDYYAIPGHKFPRNTVCLRAGMKEALLDIREHKYGYRKDLYHKALRMYDQLCKELADREYLEHTVEIALYASMPN